MSKPNGKRFKLGEMRAKRAESLGGQYVEIEGEDGEVVLRIPRMAFWDAKSYEEFVTSSGTLRTDLATLRHILPPEDYETLIGLDLELGDVQEIIEEISREAKRPE